VSVCGFETNAKIKCGQRCFLPLQAQEILQKYLFNRPQSYQDLLQLIANFFFFKLCPNYRTTHDHS
jgi:hypothetical protein